MEVVRLLNLSFRFVTLLSLFLVYLVAWRLHSSFILQWDIGWLLQATGKLLAGGTFAEDFFSPNPPMILYLYSVPFLLSQQSGLDIQSAFRLYIFVLTTFSLYLSYQLLKLQFSKSHSWYAAGMLLVMAITWLILPSYQLGQRDVLMLTMAMPYLLLVACRLECIQVNKGLMVFSGLIAGLGFNIKPHFLLIPIVVELYYLVRRNSLLAVFRLETMSMIVVSMVYTVMILYFHPDYMSVIIPYIWHHYHQSLAAPLGHLFANPLMIYSLTPIVAYVTFYTFDQYKSLTMVLMLALIACIFSYISQRTPFNYHIFPAFFLSILIYALILAQLLQQKHFSSYLFIGILLNIFLVETFYCNFASSIYQHLMCLPIFSLGVLCALYCIFVAVFKQNASYGWVGVVGFVVLGLSYAVSYLAADSAHFDLIRFIGVCVAEGFIVYLMCSQFKESCRLYGCLLMYAVIIFYLPIYAVSVSYGSWIVHYKSDRSQLIEFVKNISNSSRQKVYVFSDNALYGSVLANETNSQLAQRFDCLWMFTDKLSHSKARDDLAVNMIMNDFKRHQPDLVFVDVRPGVFSFLDYFIGNQVFSNEWKHYQFVSNFEVKSMSSRLQVYRRMTALSDKIGVK